MSTAVTAGPQILRVPRRLLQCQAPRRQGAVAACSLRARRIQLALGILWLLDGVLQLQPSMFSRTFVTTVLLPSAAGSPGFVAGPISEAARLLAPRIVVFNALFAAVQLGIGVALVLGRQVRAALAASVAWSLGVWWLGEGLGGLLGGAASPISGAPGAVLLYGIAALLAWPPGQSAPADRVGVFSARAARSLVALVWVLGAALLAQPANLAAHGLSSQLLAGAAGEPAWLASPIRDLARLLGGGGTAATFAVMVTMLAVAIGLATGRFLGAVIPLAIALALAIWWFGQAFGGIATGSATDPNSAPLLILLTLSVSGAASQRPPARELAGAQ
ncbi:MAG: hypothetical protein M0004_07590 [Actinomycetota bacterium]|nr:hypothetical protein [Actinomycetota bacterium]